MAGQRRFCAPQTRGRSPTARSPSSRCVRAGALPPARLSCSVSRSLPSKLPTRNNRLIELVGPPGIGTGVFTRRQTAVRWLRWRLLRLTPSGETPARRAAIKSQGDKQADAALAAATGQARRGYRTANASRRRPGRRLAHVPCHPLAAGRRRPDPPANQRTYRMTPATTLGVISLGSMGRSAALSALRRGIPTWGLDLNPAAAAKDAA